MHIDWHTVQGKIAIFVASLAILLFLAPDANAYYAAMNASVVLGQRDFTSNGMNQSGAVSAQTLYFSYMAASDGQHVIVSDSGNNRYLIWNSIPTVNDQPADVVIGQPNMTSNSGNQGGSVGANTIFAARGYVTIFQGKLLIADYGNNRVLIFNHIPTTNNASADVVIGQPNFTTNSINQCGCFVPSPNTLFEPQDAFVDPTTGKFFITDGGNNRVLIFNTVPTSNNASADVVIGQTSFSGHSTGHTASTLGALPLTSRVFNGRLFVNDHSNNRVLIYNAIPTSNGANADLVLGQPDLLSNGINEGGAVGLNTLYNPNGFDSDGRRLFLDDTYNARTLIFNNLPTVNNAAADLVIGSYGTDANKFNIHGGLAIAGNLLIQGDGGNNRVLIFKNELPVSSLARTFIGQPDGKLRFTGTATTSVPNQRVVRVEYSVNGSTWTGAFPTDGTFDSATEDYYFDFDPKLNQMADQQGYTIKIRSTHDNDIDTSKVALYFQPFLTNAPVNNSFTLNRLPSFTFAVQKQRFADLKENLDHFRVMVKTNGSDWQSYIDNIPVDYNSVRLVPDNLRPNQVDTMNGTYEDKFKTVTYDQNNSVITVQSKAVDSEGNASDKFWGDGGQLLNNATYQWKVQAEDHAGQLQETDPRTLRIGTRQVVTSRPYFLLSIYAISGIPGYMDISTNHPDDTPAVLTLTTDNPKFAPTFAGHAFAGSTVTVAITDDMLATSSACLAVPSNPPCTQTYQTTVKPDSTFRITVPKAFRPGNSYDVTASVKDTGDNYNELPTFTVQVAGM